MTPNPFFSGRIPQALYEAVENHRQHSGESKTDVLVKALSAYVNAPIEALTPEIATESRLKDLENRMIWVEQLLISFQANSETKAITQSPEESISLDNIGSSDNNFDNNTDNEIAEGVNLVINFDNSVDNKTKLEIWTTSQITKRLGIKRSTLESRRERGGLPCTVNGYTIIRKIGKGQQDGLRGNAWEVQRVD